MNAIQILNYRVSQDKAYHETLVMSKSANKALSYHRRVPKGFHLSPFLYIHTSTLIATEYEMYITNVRWKHGRLGNKRRYFLVFGEAVRILITKHGATSQCNTLI